MNKRIFVRAAAALALAAAFASPVRAQSTPIKFQLDWRFEGPAALFLTPAARGYFKDAKLDVTIDAGNGSGGAVTSVASGAYDIGFADLAALMEFHANNPDAPNKPVGVMMVYNNTPASVMALKKSGIKSPADLTGKKLGAPVFDAGRRAFPIFQKANGIGAVNWISMDPPLRETMLVRGDIDAITGFTFTSLLNLEARGVKAGDVVVLPYPDYGVKLYGNAIIASPKLIKENPAAVKAFLQAFAKGMKDVIAKPAAAIEDVKARDITTFNVEHLTSLFDRVIIATGESARQVKSLARSVETKMIELGAKALSTEGEKEGEWVLVDLGDIIVHVMHPTVRQYYNLEELWGQAKARKPRATKKSTAG